MLVPPSTPSAKPPPEAVLRPARPVASRVMGERALLLHPRADEVKLTNEVGTHVWQRICEGRHRIDQIAASVASVFEVDAATAEADVASFVAELFAGGFVEWETPPSADPSENRSDLK